MAVRSSPPINIRGHSRCHGHTPNSSQLLNDALRKTPLGIDPSVWLDRLGLDGQAIHEILDTPIPLINLIDRQHVFDFSALKQLFVQPSIASKTVTFPIYQDELMDDFPSTQIIRNHSGEVTYMMFLELMASILEQFAGIGIEDQPTDVHDVHPLTRNYLYNRKLYHLHSLTASANLNYVVTLEKNSNIEFANLQQQWDAEGF